MGAGLSVNTYGEYYLRGSGLIPHMFECAHIFLGFQILEIPGSLGHVIHVASSLMGGFIFPGLIIGGTSLLSNTGHPLWARGHLLPRGGPTGSTLSRKPAGSYIPVPSPPWPL